MRVILVRFTKKKYFSSNWTRVEKRLLFWSYDFRFENFGSPPTYIRTKRAKERLREVVVGNLIVLLTLTLTIPGSIDYLYVGRS